MTLIPFLNLQALSEHKIFIQTATLGLILGEYVVDIAFVRMAFILRKTSRLDGGTIPDIIHQHRHIAVWLPQKQGATLDNLTASSKKKITSNKPFMIKSYLDKVSQNKLFIVPSHSGIHEEIESALKQSHINVIRVITRLTFTPIVFFLVRKFITKLAQEPIHLKNASTNAI